MFCCCGASCGDGGDRSGTGGQQCRQACLVTAQGRCAAVQVCMVTGQGQVGNSSGMSGYRSRTGRQQLRHVWLQVRYRWAAAHACLVTSQGQVAAVQACLVTCLVTGQGQACEFAENVWLRCVSTHAGTHKHTHTLTHENTHAHARTHAQQPTRARARTHTHTHTHTHARTQPCDRQTNLHKHTHTPSQTDTYEQVGSPSLLHMHRDLYRHWQAQAYAQRYRK